MEDRGRGGRELRRQPVERGVNRGKETAKQTLPGKQFGDEIADVAALDIRRIKPGRGQPLVQRFAKRTRNIDPFARPVAGKVALPAAEDIRQRSFHSRFWHPP